MRFMFTWLQSFFGKGIPIYQGEGSNDNVFKLKLHNVQTISNDIKIVYKRVH